MEASPNTLGAGGLVAALLLTLLFGFSYLEPGPLETGDVVAGKKVRIEFNVQVVAGPGVPNAGNPPESGEQDEATQVEAVAPSRACHHSSGTIRRASSSVFRSSSSASWVITTIRFASASPAIWPSICTAGLLVARR
jgi:hypothetical protein